MKKSIIATTLAGLLIGVGTGQSNASGYTFTDLVTLGGGYSGATGINNSGQVVGWSAYGATAFSYHATIWNGATPTDLGTLAGDYSWASGINDSGQVVGYSSTVGGTDHVTIWNGTTPTDLGTLPGDYSWGSGINNSGQVVGASDFTGNFSYRATIWNGTTPTDLGTLGGSYSGTTGINDSGQVVGYSDYGATAFNSHATIWDGTVLHTPTDLGTLVGGSYSGATGINNSGQVVGWSDYGATAFNSRATIWNGTTPTDLNDFLSVSEVNAGWVLAEATGINDNGWIVVNAYNSISHDTHAFLLTPVPEPETYALFMAGLGLMGFIARRRKNSQA